MCILHAAADTAADPGQLTAVLFLVCPGTNAERVTN